MQFKGYSPIVPSGPRRVKRCSDGFGISVRRTDEADSSTILNGWITGGNQPTVTGISVMEIGRAHV